MVAGSFDHLWGEISKFSYRYPGVSNCFWKILKTAPESRAQGAWNGKTDFWVFPYFVSNFAKTDLHVWFYCETSTHAVLVFTSEIGLSDQVLKSLIHQTFFSARVLLFFDTCLYGTPSVYDVFCLTDLFFFAPGIWRANTKAMISTII